MKFLSILLTAACALATCVSGAPAGPPPPPPNREVQLYQWNYQRGQLAGNIRAKVIGRRRNVGAWYTDGRSWNQIPARYYGPAERGYEYWTFQGPAPRATEFYIRLDADRQTYYDPQQGRYYSVNQHGGGNHGPPDHNHPPPPPFNGGHDGPGGNPGHDGPGHNDPGHHGPPNHGGKTSSTSSF
ncbi:hypothetical protein AA313_de0200301 [Arthrobotrys entomopaga]|nr:hypothetical protein AA313_de0200301 [Arthrobotrys entomopaga]